MTSIEVPYLSEEEEEIESVVRLTADLRAAAIILTAGQARYLVDYYYEVQQMRIRAAAQIRASVDAGEPNELLRWNFDHARKVEGVVKRALGLWADQHPVGRWAQSICGIGPVLSAGLLAHIDIAKAPTAGHIWRFAGLDPSLKWEKKTKRPYNAALKVLCFKVGESFIKNQSRKQDFYGQFYVERKRQEIERNEAGLFADQAAAILTERRIGHETEAYKAYSVGKLPPAQLHARARRFAVKLFLSHYQAVAWEIATGSPPAVPYILNQPGHVHAIAPPNWPMV